MPAVGLLVTPFSVEELNNRTDYSIERTNTGDATTTQIDRRVIAERGVPYSTTPYNLRITMINSGLYHFRSRVPSYMSYCNLATEFVVC